MYPDLISNREACFKVHYYVLSTQACLFKKQSSWKTTEIDFSAASGQDRKQILSQMELFFIAAENQKSHFTLKKSGGN